MKPFIQTVRAVGCEFGNRQVKALWVPFGAGGFIVSFILVWLVSLDRLWLLLAVPLWLIMVFGVVLLLTARMVIEGFCPKQDQKQRLVVIGFVDKLQRVSEVVGTPPFLIVLRLIFDIVRPRPQGFIAQAAKDGTTLHKDFFALQKLFQ